MLAKGLPQAGVDAVSSPSFPLRKSCS